MNGNEFMADGNAFAADLKDMLRKWSWPEWLINEKWPRILDVLVGVGILQTGPEGFSMTYLVESDEAWDTAWQALEKEGIVGGEGPAG